MAVSVKDIKDKKAGDLTKLNDTDELEMVISDIRVTVNYPYSVDPVDEHDNGQRNVPDTIRLTGSELSAGLTAEAMAELRGLCEQRVRIK